MIKLSSLFSQEISDGAQKQAQEFISEPTWISAETKKKSTAMDLLKFLIAQMKKVDSNYFSAEKDIFINTRSAIKKLAEGNVPENKELYAMAAVTKTNFIEKINSDNVLYASIAPNHKPALYTMFTRVTTDARMKEIPELARNLLDNLPAESFSQDNV